MSTITQQPDSLSFSQNLKRIIVSSTETVSFQLSKGGVQVLDEVYQPGEGDLVEIDLRDTIDRLLSIIFPGAGVTDQVNSHSDFTCTVDGTSFTIHVIKGGVADPDGTAEAFIDDHFLSWQVQDKRIIQTQPEWLSIYTKAARVIKVKAYFKNDPDETLTLHSLAANHVYSFDASWAAINEALITKNPLAWDIWFEDNEGNRLSFIQRYRLRNRTAIENVFIWTNTLGGIDSISFLGNSEDDRKLEHQLSELYDESFEEYDIDDKKREIKQSTGYLTKSESRWIFDFFLSRKRYRVMEDGNVRSIVFVSSKFVDKTEDDLNSYEFSYKYSSDVSLLNLDKTFDPLPAPEVPDDFFLTELLAGLTAAQYADNLLLAVQSPFAQGWQKFSMGQLKNSLLNGISISGHSHIIADITGLQVALDGKSPVHSHPYRPDTWVPAWNDITGKPTVFIPDTHSHAISDITGLQTALNNKSDVHTHPYRPDNWVPSWTDVTGKPTTFTPSAHGHAWSEITSKPDWVAKMGWDVANSRVTISEDLHVTGNIYVTEEVFTYFAAAVGSDVLDNLVAVAPLYKPAPDQVGLKINGLQFEVNASNELQIQAGVLVPASHSHIISDVTGLQTALDAKMAVHTHPYRPDTWVPDWTDVTGKPSTFAPSSHSHIIADVTGLQTALDGKSAVHSHPYRADTWVPSWTEVTDKPSTFTPSSHGHAWSEITSKPTWESKLGWDAVNGRVTISTDLHVTGNIFATLEVLTYFTNAVGSDVLANLTATAPLYKSSASNIQLLYNTTQFEVNGSNQLQIKSGILAPAAHSHIISDVTGLQTALDSKMAIHTHPYRPDTWVPSWSDVTGKPSTFTPSSHGHAWGDLSGVPSTFTPSAHTHIISEVTGLQTALDGKSAVHSHPYLSDVDARISQWSTAYGWGDWRQINSKVTVGPSGYFVGNSTNPFAFNDYTDTYNNFIIYNHGDTSTRGNARANSMTAQNITITDGTNVLRIGTLSTGADALSGGILLHRYWNGANDYRASAIFNYYGSSASQDMLAFGVSTDTNPYDIAKVKMVIGANDVVGIGTTNPTIFGGKGLEVSGTNQVGIRVSSVGNGGIEIGASAGIHYIQTTATGASISFYTGNASTNTLFLKHDGCVGIGTTTPFAKFHVFTTTGQLALFGGTGIGTASGNYTGIALGYSELNYYAKSAIVQEQVGDNAARGKIHFLNNGNADSISASLNDSKMTIHYNGNIGIGTTSPNYRLHVAGNIAVNSGYRIGTTDPNASTYKASIQFGDPVSDNEVIILRESATPRGIYLTGSGTAMPATYSAESRFGIDIKTVFGNVVVLTDNAYFRGSPTYGFRFNNFGDTYNNYIIYDNGNTWTRGTAEVKDAKSETYIIKNSSGVTRWTIELGSNDEIKFKNAAGVVEFIGDQSGNLRARGEVYTYDTNI